MKFIKQYFVDPIIYKNGYNVYNTITYALLFVVFSYLIYESIPKKIKIDSKFILSSIPFILLGSTLHVLEDAGIFNTFLLITPMVWILLATYAFLSFFISFEIYGHENYYKLWGALGAIPLLIFLSMIKVNYPIYLFNIILSTIISCTIAYIISRRLNFMNKFNMNVLFIHMFDASTTFSALLTGDYFEEHVIGGIFTRIFGPIGMYVLKIPVLLFVFWELEKEKNVKLRNFVYLLIIILGLGPGTRNMLRLIMGV